MTFHAYKGFMSYELQIGTLVIQVPYRAFRRKWGIVHVFKDDYGSWR